MYLLCLSFMCFCNEPATTDIYTSGHPHSLPDALPICNCWTMKGSGHTCPNISTNAPRLAPLSSIRNTALPPLPCRGLMTSAPWRRWKSLTASRRSEEHTSELQSLMRISYAVFCLKKQNHNKQHHLDYKHKHKTT